MHIYGINFRQGVLVRNREQKTILHDWLNLNPRWGRLRSQKANVDLPSAQSIMLLGDGHLAQFELYIRIKMPETLHDRWEETVG